MKFQKKKLQFKGMVFKSNGDGSFDVSADKGLFSDKCSSFGEATMWIHEMADNNDIGREFCSRICDAFGCDVDGNRIPADWL